MLEGASTGTIVYIVTIILIVMCWLIKVTMEATRDIFYTDRDEDAG